MRDASDDSPDALIDGGAGHVPERRCILTGEHGPRAGLIRLALGPDDAVWPDLAAKLPGRGAWIAPSRSLLAKAIASGKLKGALARAFRTTPPTIELDLADRIARGLEQRALQRLGLEHRAGHVVFGSERLNEWARSGRLYLMMHVADAAADGSSKLDQAFRAGDGTMDKVITLPVGRLALSSALGRDNMVHIGISDPKAAMRVESDVARWVAFLSTDEEKARDGEPARAIMLDGNGPGRSPDWDSDGSSRSPDMIEGRE